MGMKRLSVVQGFLFINLHTSRVGLGVDITFLADVSK